MKRTDLCLVVSGLTQNILSFHPPVRLHGSYESLWAGQVSEALVDLSGGLAERWSLEKGGPEETGGPGRDSDHVRRRKLDLSLLLPVRDLCALSCSAHGGPGGQAESPRDPCFECRSCIPGLDLWSR